MSTDYSSQLPVIDFIPQDEMNPRSAELRKYFEMFFDPKYDGFQDELEYICDVPHRASKDVKASHLGVGFELLDHRCGYDFDKVIPIMKESGVKWARLQSGWPKAEQEKGVYNFDWLDHIVDGLLEAGIQPWFSLSFGNGLYMGSAKPVPPHNTYMFSPTVFGEECIHAWENYCKAMAEHFKTRVFHWEVWNEPNAGFFRKPFEKSEEIAPMIHKIVWEPPSEYAKFVAITEKALHQVQPEAKIIGGSIAGCAICNEYIQGLFDNGIAEHIDIFTYHPYQGIPEIYYHDRLQFIRDKIAESGRNIVIWQGENGRPSETITLHRGWKSTEGSQARYLTRRYITDLREEIDMTSYFLCCDIGNGYLKGTVHAQGVIDARDPDNYKPKLSFRAMQSFAWLFDAEVKKMNCCFEIMPMVAMSYTTRFCREAITATTCGFRYKDIPIYSYYQVSNVDADSTVMPIKIETYIGNLKLDKPILIDPITARVYRIKKLVNFCDGNYGYNLLFPRLPILDYPLFLTDARILDK